MGMRWWSGVACRVWVFVLLAVAGGWVSASAGGEEEQARLLSEASALFQQASQSGDPAQGVEFYGKAALRFEKLHALGVRNGKLYYNLGNTYFQLHDLGRAILNYRRALAYLPGDDNLRHNLGVARALQGDRIEAKEEARMARLLFFWHYALPARVRLLLLMAANAVFWGGLGLRLHGRRPFSWALFLALGVGLLLAGSLLYERLHRQQAGVLVAEESTARKGDGPAYAPSFDGPLHAGLEFVVVQRRGDWLHIELADGRRCWVEAASVELL